MPMLNRFTAAAAILFATGLALLALSVRRGEGTAGIAVFIPFFVGSGPLSSLGVLCFFIGMVLLFFGMARSAAEAADAGGQEEPGAPDRPEGPARTDGPESPAPPNSPAQTTPRPHIGGVILIGPIPIVFGSDPGISKAMFYMALGLMAMFLVVLLALAFL
jgi:uncharacterized protein (TIGR00304 family)